MSIRRLTEFYEVMWMFESHAQQRLAWEDAAQARIARDRAEALAAAQMKTMLGANPSGQLGHSKIDDEEALRKAGLL